MVHSVAAALAAALQCGFAAASPGAVHIGGSVLDAATLKPLASAEIRLSSSTSCTQISDRLGHFHFAALPAGKYTIAVAYLGYQSVRDSFLVAPNASVDLDIQLDQSAIPIDPIKVTVRSQYLDRMGFYGRKTSGAGTFLTRAQIERMNGIGYTSDLVRNLSGVRVTPRRGHGGNRVVGRNSCAFRYYVDGFKTDPQFELDDIEPQYVEALEIYTGVGQIPAEYSSESGLNQQKTCGVILIWTRQRH